MNSRLRDGERTWNIVSRFHFLSGFWDYDYVMRESQRPCGSELDMSWLQSLAEGDPVCTTDLIKQMKLLEHHLSELSGVAGFQRLRAGLRARLDEFDSTLEHVRLAVWLGRASVLREIEPSISDGGRRSDCRAEVVGEDVFFESYRPLPRPSNRINSLMFLADSNVDYPFRVKTLREKLSKQLPSEVTGVISVPIHRDPLCRTWVGVVLEVLSAFPNVAAAVLWSRLDLRSADAQVVRPLASYLPKPYLVPNPAAKDRELLENIKIALA